MPRRRSARRPGGSPTRSLQGAGGSCRRDKPAPGLPFPQAKVPESGSLWKWVIIIRRAGRRSRSMWCCGTETLWQWMSAGGNCRAKSGTSFPPGRSFPPVGESPETSDCCSWPGIHGRSGSGPSRRRAVRIVSWPGPTRANFQPGEAVWCWRMRPTGWLPRSVMREPPPPCSSFSG